MAGWNLPFPSTRDGVCPLGTLAQARAQATLRGHWTVRRLPLPRVVRPHPRGGLDTGREVSHTVPGPFALLHPGSADSFLCVQLGPERGSGSSGREPQATALLPAPAALRLPALDSMAGVPAPAAGRCWVPGVGLPEALPLGLALPSSAGFFRSPPGPCSALLEATASDFSVLPSPAGCAAINNPQGPLPCFPQLWLWRAVVGLAPRRESR